MEKLSAEDRATFLRDLANKIVAENRHNEVPAAAVEPAEAGVRKRGRKPSDRSRLLNTLLTRGIKSEALQTWLDEHEIPHVQPVDKHLGRGLTDEGRVKLIVRGLDKAAIEHLEDEFN